MDEERQRARPTDLPLEWLLPHSGSPGVPGTLVVWDLYAAPNPWRTVDSAAHVAAFMQVVGRQPGRRVRAGVLPDPLAALEMLRVNGVDRATALRRLPRYLPVLVKCFGELWASRDDRAARVSGWLQVTVARFAADPGTVQSFIAPNLRAILRRKLAAAGIDRYLDADLGACGSDQVHRTAQLSLAVQRVRARHGLQCAEQDVVVLGAAVGRSGAGRHRPAGRAKSDSPVLAIQGRT